jgi:hypothetical protein
MKNIKIDLWTLSIIWFSEKKATVQNWILFPPLGGTVVHYKQLTSVAGPVTQFNSSFQNTVFSEH